MIVTVLIITAITIAYYFLQLNYQYWKKRGVSGPKPRFLLGNLTQSFLLKKSPSEVLTDIYNEYQNVPIVGVYRASTPSLLVRDPELIKEITVKSFNNFHDNDVDIDKKIDRLFGRHPFVLKGEEWKIVRAQLTPGFTSGKMKWLYPHLQDTGEQLVKFIGKQPGTTNGDGYEAKELCTRFTLNNVASCAFGLEAKCFEEENSEFRQLAKKFLTPTSWASIMFFLTTLIPIISKIVSVKFTSKEVEDKLMSIVTETLKYREENNVVRNDFLHIINELKKTCKDYEFTDLDVTAHAAGFFGDGYETSSIIMSFVLYELAANPEAQAKLREEINKNIQENDDKLPYEIIQEMPYLDGVINESLRMHPAIFTLHKLCTKQYTYVPKDGRPVVIEEGTPIVLPVYGLQHDPKYFQDPESFKPERFIGANKDSITKCTFMPFGDGPRACLGQRFGVLQIKTGVAQIIKNYHISVNKKTKVPFKYDPIYIMVSPIGGLWIDFKKIV